MAFRDTKACEDAPWGVYGTRGRATGTPARTRGRLTLLALLAGGLAGPAVAQAHAPQLLLLPPPLACCDRVAVVALLELHLQAGQVLLDPVKVHPQLLPLDSALLGGHALHQREKLGHGDAGAQPGGKQDRYAPALEVPASVSLFAG